MSARKRAEFNEMAVEPVIKGLRARIANGQYKPGQMLASERALADEYGVSRVAVRAALGQLEKDGTILCKPNCRPVIGEVATPEAPQFGGIRNVWCWLWAYAGDPGASDLYLGIQQGIRDPGLRVSLARSPGGDWPSVIAFEERLLRSLPNNADAAGLIIWYLGGEENLEPLRQLQRSGLPLVFVDRMPPGMDGDYVGTENRGSAKDAVRHLIALGHSSLHCVSNGDDVSSVRDRIAGFRDALEEAGLWTGPELVHEMKGAGDEDLDRRTTRRLMSLPNAPSAIFCVNDVVAITLYQALVKEGYRIPEDVSIVGFDGFLRSMPGGGYLTSAFQNFERMGEQAAQLLQQRINRESSASYRHILIDAPLQQHGSTAPPALR